jgi:hypothetical protein
MFTDRISDRHRVAQCNRQSRRVRGALRNGLTKDAAGGFTMGLFAVAFLPFLSAFLMLILGDDPARERGILFRGRRSTEPD